MTIAPPGVPGAAISEVTMSAGDLTAIKSSKLTTEIFSKHRCCIAPRLLVLPVELATHPTPLSCDSALTVPLAFDQHSKILFQPRRTSLFQELITQQFHPDKTLEDNCGQIIAGKENACIYLDDHDFEYRFAAVPHLVAAGHGNVVSQFCSHL